jgi:hypothetical protein
MRGVVFTGDRGLELMQFPDPTTDPHDGIKMQGRIQVGCCQLGK